MNQEQQDKQAFFAQYWGQTILVAKINGAGFKTYKIESAEMHNHFFTYECYLELTPLSDITDEDAIEVANIMDVDPVLLTKDEFHLRFGKEGDCIGIWFDGEILIDGEQCPLFILQVYDFLRSRGYLLPFRNYTTAQLIEMGWVKLKTNV